MKIAIVHHCLVRMRGGEKVLEVLCEIFPQADIYTVVYDKDQVSSTINSHIVYTSFVQKLPFSKSKYPYYLAFFPLAFEQLDLRDYDLVISSDAYCAKGVLTKSEILHICYCHSPMRFAWDLYFNYLEDTPFLVRKLAPPVMHYLRIFDYAAAQRVDYFIANSKNTARKIRKCYGREAEVIYPPVDVDYFITDNKKQSEDFYFYLGELVPYKRADLIVDAFNELGRSLKIIGQGPQFRDLKRKANSNIELLGKQSDEVVKDHFLRCKAFIFAAEEDFGITSVEAQACGKPVIAYKKGGVLETVVEGKTGTFFEKQTVDSLIQTIRRFEEFEFDPNLCRENALRFGRDRCKKKLRSFIFEKYKQWKGKNSS